MIQKLISPNSSNNMIPKLISPNSPNFMIPKLTSPNSPNLLFQSSFHLITQLYEMFFSPSKDAKPFHKFFRELGWVKMAPKKLQFQSIFSLWRLSLRTIALKLGLFWKVLLKYIKMHCNIRGI